MKRLFLSLVLLFSMSANAATVVYSAPGVVTAIGNLDVNGVLYNVDFEVDAYSTYGGTTYPWNLSINLPAAFSAINSVLNGAGAVKVNNGLQFYGPYDTPGSLYYVQFGGADSFIIGTNIFSNDSPKVWGTTYTIDGPPSNYWNAAPAWSLAAVPIPGAVWLLGSGLGLLGFLRRKRLPSA